MPLCVTQSFFMFFKFSVSFSKSFQTCSSKLKLRIFLSHLTFGLIQVGCKQKHRERGQPERKFAFPSRFQEMGQTIRSAGWC